MSGTNRPVRHHYIPVFYLKRWTGPDGRLCEFNRPWKGVVKPKRVHPAGTAYLDRLNSVEGLPEEEAHEVEEKFFSPIDSAAAEAIAILESGGHLDWDSRTRSAWTRFLLSLLLRMPEELAQYREYYTERLREVGVDEEAAYQEAWQEGFPLTFAEWMEQLLAEKRFVAMGAFRTLFQLIDNPDIGQTINSMIWGSLGVPGPYELLTSDRPLTTTAGLGKPEAAIVLPIGPRRLFIGANQEATMDHIKSLKGPDLIAKINAIVAGQAVKYVYGSNDSQRRFVQNRMGKVPMRSLAGEQLKELRRKGSRGG